MSDDGNFNVLVRPLTGYFARRAVEQRLGRAFSVVLPGLALFALAVFMVLTGTAPFLISLAVVLALVFEVLRLWVVENKTSTAGRKLG